MTLEEYGQQHNGYIDIDVMDTELDIYVCFTHELGDVNDNQTKILDYLAKKVKIVNEKTDVLICDFSGFFKTYNKVIRDYCVEHKIQNNEDEEESYLWMVEKLPSIISGYANEKTYIDIITILNI
jgi:hypothetical protein